MARPLRIEFPGALYHITSRGDGREDIYRGDGDRRLFLDLLSDTCERFNWWGHAYCLMTNHYHLLVETPDANLAKGMRQLNGVYTQRFNDVHRRCGHVFQGRYKAIIVQKKTYLKELARYIVLNPVRARMVARPEGWPWSSYRATTGEAACPDWLRTDWLLSVFGTSEQAAVAEQRGQLLPFAPAELSVTRSTPATNRVSRRGALYHTGRRGLGQVLPFALQK